MNLFLDPDLNKMGKKTTKTLEIRLATLIIVEGG